MDLLEYQAKELFREMGIPVLPSQRIDRPKDLKGLSLPYPVVLKSQVYIGGRGRVGGVRFVENTIDAIAAAQTIFNLPIMGEYPKLLLAEAKYDVEREFYLAITLNRSVSRPILLGSQQGGMDVQAAIDQMQHIVVEEEFSPYYARRLAVKMGLQGLLIETVSAVIEKMYRLFLQYDLDLVEINPLGVSASGEVMALDGKVTVNDEALGRHPHLFSLIETLADPSPVPDGSVPVMLKSKGQIGVLCNGAGLTMATMDLVEQGGGQTACYFNIGGETCWNASPAVFKQRMEQGLMQMARESKIRVILVNLISSLVSCDEMAEVIVAYLRQRQGPANALGPLAAEHLLAQASQVPALVVRLVGCQHDRARNLLASVQMTLIEDLDEAVTQAIALTHASPVSG